MSKIEIKKAKTGMMFNLVANNGQVIATSQIYKSRSGLNQGVRAVMRTPAEAAVEDQTQEKFKVVKHPKFEVYADKAGEFRFRLKARNGQIICVGEGYTSLEACLKGIRSVKRNAPVAEIVEL